MPWWKWWVLKYVDYLLKDFWLNLAIIEAKREELPVTEWLEQVKWYWASLSFWEEMKTKLERAEYVRWQWMVQSIENLTAKKFIEYLLWYYSKHWSEEIVQSKLWDLIKLYSKDELSIVDFTKRVGWQHILMNMWKNVQGELFRI